MIVDDALQGVTHIVRGMDLFEQTSIHRLLQTLLGLPEPIYHHHRLILRSDRRETVEKRGINPVARIATQRLQSKSDQIGFGF